MSRILVVDDDPRLRELLRYTLEKAGNEITEAQDGIHALKKFAESAFDLIVLDVTMPELDGLETCRTIRKTSRIPIVFLSSRDEELDKILGLELGGDDYITKPFSYPELVARIRAVLRRAEGSGDLSLTKNVSVVDEPFDFCGGRVNPQRLELVLADGTVIKIGRKEIGIMAHLKAHEGEVIPRKALIHAVWGIHANVRSRSLDQYIVKVRDFCRASPAGVEALRTVHGVGYIFDPDGKHHAAA